MASTIPLLLVLLLVGQLQGRAKAHPIDRSDLADFKALLERLEDQLQPEERHTALERGFHEPNGGTVEDSSWEDEDARPRSEGGLGLGSQQPPERMPAAARDKPRVFFHAPRNGQRPSSCFGQRLDRIGTTSGMGCKRRN